MSHLFVGFHLGAISIIILFNYLWYLHKKERAYLYYILLQIAILLLFLHSTKILETSALYTSGIAVLCSIFFAKEYLNIKHYYPKINQFLTYFSIFYILFILLVDFFNIYQSVFTKVPQSLFFSLYIVVGYLIYKKGYQLAIYFVVAWGIFTLLTLSAFFTRNFSSIPEISIYLIQMGNLIEAIVLSFALAAKNRKVHQEKEEQEKMLIHQSRLASMGEMLANISHQWRQPLSRVSAINMNMQLHLMDHYDNEQYLNNKLEESQDQLEYMSNTIDDFIYFYQRDKKREDFMVSQCIDSAENIVRSSIDSQQITIEKDYEEDFKLHAYPKELSQVVLNLIQNAKDQFSINNIENALLKITLKKNKIIIEDNAGGVDPSVMNRVFEPYFTTKERYKGTGLGLYMSRNILEKNFHATIEVENINQGAQFTITFGDPK